MKPTDTLEQRIKLARGIATDVVVNLKSEFNVGLVSKPEYEPINSPWIQSTMRFGLKDFQKLGRILSSRNLRSYNFAISDAGLHGEKYKNHSSDCDVNALLEDVRLQSGTPDLPDYITVIGYDGNTKTALELIFEATSSESLKTRAVLREADKGTDKFNWYNISLERK